MTVTVQFELWRVSAVGEFRPQNRTRVISLFLGGCCGRLVPGFTSAQHLPLDHPGVPLHTDIVVVQHSVDKEASAACRCARERERERERFEGVRASTDVRSAAD